MNAATLAAEAARLREKIAVLERAGLHASAKALREKLQRLLDGTS